MLKLKNFKEHPVTTLGGILVGLLQAGVTSAAIAYSQNPGQVTDWKPYAAAAASGMVSVIIGGMLPSKDKQPVVMEGLQSEPISQIDPLVQEAVQRVMVQSVLEKLDPK